jgi:ribosome recycling factor
VIRETLKDAEARMNGAIQSLESDLSGIRTGRASSALVDKIQVEYYGAPTPLLQLATISVPEPRSLLIKPFDPSTMRDIERAILASDLGITPGNDGKAIRLNLPPLTEDRRKELVKVVKNRVEEARVSVRNVRRDVMKDLKEIENEKLASEDERKTGEADLQKLTDKYVVDIDAIGEKKQEEIMEV